MTKAELKLAGRLMEMAADIFSNHGCNDLEASVYEGITAEEKADLVDRFNRFNAGAPEDDCTLEWIGDSSWMSYFADRLQAAAAERTIQ